MIFHFSPCDVCGAIVKSGQDTAALEAERKRRALAQGSTGNITSNLSGAVADAGAASRKTLLGG